MAQVQNKFNFSKILFKLLSILLVTNLAIADAHEKNENFQFIDQMVKFEKKSKSGSCFIEILSPELILKDDPELASKMNAHLDNFVKNSQICNSKTSNRHYKTTYEIIKSSDSIIGIKFTTKHNGKIVHIDALNLNVENGEIISVEQVFKPVDKNFMTEVIKLSKHHLTKATSWTQFLEKVKHRSIQYYMNDSTWYLIFNYAIDLGKEPFTVKVPKSFLK